MRTPRLALILAILLAGCAAKVAPIQIIQVTHDALAQAQDLEISFCLGVPTVAAAAALPNVSHCTTAVATAIHLTDARHADFTAKVTTAITLHRSITAQFAAGATSVDTTLLQTAITELLTLISQLQQTPAVVQLSTTVASARIQ